MRDSLKKILSLNRKENIYFFEKMKTKLVIFGCIVILSTVFFLTRSSSSKINLNNHAKSIQKRAYSTNPNALRLNDRSDHLLWFVHVSFIHFSIIENGI